MNMDGANEVESLLNQIHAALLAGKDPDVVGKEFEDDINSIKNESGAYVVHYAAYHGLTDVLTVILPVQKSWIIDKISDTCPPVLYQYAADDLVSEDTTLKSDAGEKKVNLRRIGHYGHVTPLMCAVYSENSKAVEMVCDYDPDPNVANSVKYSPLIYAAFSAQVEMIDTLLTKFSGEINLNAQNTNLYTAVHVCVYGPEKTFEQRYAIAEKLLLAGASLDTQDSNLYTPLGSCVYGNEEHNLAFAKLFLRFGADPQQHPNCHGRTAMDDAQGALKSLFRSVVQFCL